MVEPRYRYSPARGDDSFAREAVEWLRSVKVDQHADPWQEAVLLDSLRTEAPGDPKWVSLEVGVDVPRQNGKGGVIIDRQLIGAYLLEERLQTYSSHQFDTSLEAFDKLIFTIEGSAELTRSVKKVSRSHGDEGIRFLNGCRIRFRTRTKGGGRGFTADCLYLDEAMIVSDFMHGALLPTLSARPNPQVWYLGSAVDQIIHEHGVVFARVRERGIKGEDPSLTYVEFSAPFDHPDKVSDEDALDVGYWQAANPAFGVRISQDFVELEQRSMDPRTFAVERLGVGDWPRTDHRVETVIDLDEWMALLDEGARILDPACLAYDVSPDRFGSIAIAGRSSSGHWQGEVAESRPGTGWMVPRIAQIVEKHRPTVVVCDAYGPAATLVAPLAELGIEVQTFSASDHARACARFVDLIGEKEFRHLGSAELVSAIRSAQTRPLGDAWAWSRKNSTGNISPLVSVTLAVSAAVENIAPQVFGMSW